MNAAPQDGGGASIGAGARLAHAVRMFGAIATAILNGLAAIGRTGARGLALSLVAGLAVPALGAWLKPALPLLVGLFVTIGFARIDFSRARDLSRRPWSLAIALVWLVVSLPLTVWICLGLVGREGLSGGLVLGLSLQAAAAPILATPAIALLLGLEPTFALLLLTGHMAILPLVAPLVASFVAGDAVPLDGWAIARNLALLLAGAWSAAAAIRKIWPLAAIRRAQREIDGFNIVLFFIFAIAIFDGIAARALAEPWLVVGYTALAFAVALVGHAAGFLALRRATSPGDAFVVGYATGNRNAGLMVAAMGGALPPDTWLYFACVQGPIYLAPWLVAPLARRLVGRDPSN